MIEIKHTKNSIFNLGIALSVLVGGSLFVCVMVLYSWLTDYWLPWPIWVATVLMVGAMLSQSATFVRSYLRESSILGISVDGIQLKTGKTYRFDQAESILFNGFTTFRIKFSDGWIFQPLYLDADLAKTVSDLIRRYIENSPRKTALIDAINAELEKQHNASAYIIIVLSVLLMGVSWLPVMNIAHPLFSIVVGGLPLSYGLYKRFYKRPKSFDQNP